MRARREAAEQRAALSMEELAHGGLPAGASEQERLAQESEQFLQSFSGWDGANSNASRGWIYWPGLDSKRDLDTFSRRELARKARWLCANMGLPNRIVKGLADLIGYLTPVWDSGDREWDELVEQHFEERTESPLAVDRSGQYSLQQLQLQLDSAAFLDGDVLPAALESRSGGLLMMMYEGGQVQTPDEADEADGWHEGIQLDRFRRPRRFALTQDDGSSRYVSARDGFYYSHPDTLGRVRPPTALAHAINHLVDVSEIVADWKLAIKVAAQVGIYLKSTGNAGPWGATPFFSGVRNERARPPQTDEAEGVAGAAPATDGSDDKDVKIEDIYGGPGVFNAPNGRELATVQDQRPHPNSMNLLSHMMRDMSWGTGTSPELLWDISGLRGANTRWAGADLGRWIGCRLLRKRAWMKRYCATWAAKEMRAQRLPEPKVASAKFWKMGFIPQASLTADKGREGKLNMDLVAAKMRSLKTHFAEEGKHWLKELRQIGREDGARRELLGLED